MSNTFAQVNNAAHTAALGNNRLPMPSNAQLDAGNYAKGHIRINGLDVAIENPAYTYRKSTDKTGQQWSCLMQAHYGYINGYKGNDGDNIDAFVGSIPENDTAYIINQKTQGGFFDEHKVMLGFLSQQQAVDTYQHCFERGWTGLMSVVPCTMSQLKWWLANGDKARPVTKERLPYAGLERLDSVVWGGTDDANLYSHGGQLSKLLYQIRLDDTNNQALEPLAYHDMIAELGNQGFMYENYDALIVEYNKLERKAKQLLMVMQGAADTVKPVSVTVSKPLTKNGVSNVIAWFEMDDGQAVGVFFHNPDKNPKKLDPTDEMISYKWVLNKKDITIAVAPENGKDVIIRTVAKRIMQLVEKNHDRFAKANSDKAELNQKEQSLGQLVIEKQSQLDMLNSDIEALEAKKAEKEANKAPTAEELTKQGFDGIATELKKLGWTDDLVMGGLTKSFVGAKESGSVNEDGVLNVNVSRENGLIRAQVGADTLIPNSVDNIPQYGLNAQTEQSYKKVADKVNNAVDAYVEQRKVELAINGKSTLSANQSTDYGFTFIKDDFDKNKYRLLDADGKEYQVIWKSGATWTMMTGETFKTLADAKNAAIDHALNRKETERQEKASRAEVDGMRTVDENNSEVERIAALYASELGHPVSKRSREFANDILSKNAYGLEFIANGMNDKGKKVFSEVTGVSLPKQQGATWKAIRDWAGVSDEQENYRVAVRDVAYEIKAFMRENNVSQEMADKNKALIASKIAEGFDNVEKIGNSYWFTNNAGQGINLSEKPQKGYLGLSKSRALVVAMIAESKAKKQLDSTANQSIDSEQKNTGIDLTAQDRPSNWRTNLANARAVAKSLGIETKGKKLANLVGEIDATDAEALSSAPVTQPEQAPVVPTPTPAAKSTDLSEEEYAALKKAYDEFNAKTDKIGAAKSREDALKIATDLVTEIPEKEYQIRRAFSDAIRNNKWYGFEINFPKQPVKVKTDAELNSTLKRLQKALEGTAYSVNGKFNYGSAKLKLTYSNGGSSWGNKYADKTIDQIKGKFVVIHDVYAKDAIEWMKPLVDGMLSWLNGETVPKMFLGNDLKWDTQIGTPRVIDDAFKEAKAKAAPVTQPNNTLQKDISKSELFKDANVWAIDDFGKENGMVIYSRDEQDGFSIGIVDKLKQVNMQYTDIDTDQQTNESFSTENITNEQVIEKIKMFIAKHEQKSVELLPVQPVSEPPMTNPDRDYLQSIIDGEVDLEVKGITAKIRQIIATAKDANDSDMLGLADKAAKAYATQIKAKAAAKLAEVQ